jgi:hypothetical protein
MFGSSVRSLFDWIVARSHRRAGEGTNAPERDRDCEFLLFAEILAASAYLDFGGWPIELRVPPHSDQHD